MQFTSEIGGSTINFLDLTLTFRRHSLIQKIEFSIYRKPTFTGISIAHDSCHPQNQKIVVINSSIPRLIHLPLSTDVIRKETCIIQQIANKNGLKTDILKLIRRRRLHHLLSLPENRDPHQPPPSNVPQRQRWIRLPFLGKPSYKMERELKKLDLRVGFYPLVTLGQAFCSKDPIPPQKKSGIYLLNCGQCDAHYVGQTGRPLEKRIGEHRRAFANKKLHHSAMARHCLENHHDFDMVQSTLLHSCVKSQVMNKLEEIETIAAYSTNQQNLLNDLDSVYVTPFTRFYYNFSPPLATV